MQRISGAQHRYTSPIVHARLTGCFVARMVHQKPFPKVEIPASFRSTARRACCALLCSFFLTAAGAAAAQRLRLPSSKGGIVELSSSGPQRRQGDVFSADGDVDIRYGDLRLRADHVEYNAKTADTFARGHLQFDYLNQHLEADEAHYNVHSGRGTFRKVRGAVKLERRPNPALLVTDNPLSFEAEEVERLGDDEYIIRRARLTVCDPSRPKWQFYAPRAHIRIGKKAVLVNANFRLFRVPLIWIPYATAPAGRNVRQSGFLIPDVGNSTRKGFFFGDAYYWAPTTWMDATLGAQFLSRRGSSQRVEFRARPSEDSSIFYNYFGVRDRGLPDASGVRQPQGGHQQQFEAFALLPNGWRAVADVNQLSSLTFRLAFAETFGEAVNSEVRSALFLTNNFHGFSLNFAAVNDKSFLTIQPETSVVLRNAPEARFSSVEQAPWKRLPLYFAFTAFAGAVHRTDQDLNTAAAVQRSEFAPRVTIPLHFGPWLSVTTMAAFRTTRYGASLDDSGVLIEKSILRNTGEFTLDLRPPVLEKIFSLPGSTSRWKHTIEPEITYRYVTGVHNFDRFIRFDQDSTLTDTSEVEYSITQRLFRKEGDGPAEEFLSWRVLQKHYFDPTFGGAIVPGQRNVFEALNSITPFAFAGGPRTSSPVISDLKITPAGRFDAEQILEYDAQRGTMTAIGTLAKVKPYDNFFATVAHFRVEMDPVLQSFSNQVRAMAGYGELNRKGFNIAAGVSYDITRSFLQNQLIQGSYNGGCCGITVEYRRLALGTVRTENQFRFAFIIANIGTFGNVRRQEKIF
jgi:LPS-assembly protein